ncbi:alpha/beta hydrolase [Bacteroidota bacterium]
MSNFPFALVLLLLHHPISPGISETNNEPVIYLLPGTGADCRLFNKINFPYDTVHLEFPIPEKKLSLQDYAYSFIPRIDTNRGIILIGVSLGGMISTELADTLSPERVIIISSAKCRDELPGTYKFQRFVPLNRIAPKKMIKWGSKVIAPAVEPERKQDTIFRTMLMAKDPAYLKWTVNMIINWQREEYDSSIVHIHGDNDSTLPIRNINYDFLIPDGSHMMVYIRGKELSELINDILKE